MKKWGTKSEIGAAIIFTTIVVDLIFDLNPYIQIAGAITGLLLILSSTSTSKTTVHLLPKYAVVAGRIEDPSLCVLLMS